ncbi:thiamine pyrophosphate-binding protein, partial [Streptosporangium sp. NPDC006013]|uniref:thiamine pyrophosphate-binding protein n=1 Tax=Streptosporangium sp. NPDC006013 TaxID=3155596 RepID=UPI0033A19F2E
MNVAEAVGHILASLGVDTAFGVVGSGNFHVTNALVAHGARYVAARHEGGAATMADAYARLSGRVGVLSVHQGPGLTNAMTGIAEAAKSRTPLIVLAGEATEPRSNFFVDQAALAEAVGAVPLRISSAETAAADTAEAFRVAGEGRRTVLLNLPLEVQGRHVPDVPGASVAGASGTGASGGNGPRGVPEAGEAARLAEFFGASATQIRRASELVVDTAQYVDGLRRG